MKNVSCVVLAVIFCVLTYTVGADLADCTAGAIQAELKKDSHFPWLDQSPGTFEFKHNTLKLSLLSQFVGNRTYANITFRGATADKCSTMGTADSVWAHSRNTSCIDKFALTMAWADHNVCGFEKKILDTYFQFKATFTITYVDAVGQILETDITRKTAVSYKVYVYFTRSIEVKIDNVIANSTVTLKFFLTQSEVDDNMNLDLSFTTKLDWPNMFVADTLTLTTPNNVAQAAGTQITMDNSQCSASKFYSDCLQVFHVKETITAGCTYDGEYALTATLRTCRDDTTPSCTKEDTIIRFHVTSSDVCGSVSVTPFIKGSVIALEDGTANSATRPYGDFLIGTVGYFKVVLDLNNEANGVTLDFTDITLVEINPKDPLNPSTKKLLENSFPTTNGIKTNLVTDTTQNVNTFHFDVASVVFDVPVFGYRSYMLTVNAVVTFDGNNIYQKRSEQTVEVMWEVTPGAGSVVAAKQVGLSYNPQTPAAVSAVSGKMVYSMTLLATVCVAAAVCVVVVAVAVTVVRRRSANTSTIYRSL